MKLVILISGNLLPFLSFFPLFVKKQEKIKIQIYTCFKIIGFLLNLKYYETSKLINFIVKWLKIMQK